MEKIPTAKEFIEKEYESKLERINIEGAHGEWMLKEFAKLHVKATLEAIAEKAKKTAVNLVPGKPGADWRIGFDIDSILSAYSLENVK